MSFSTLGLSAELLRAVAEKGYTQITPIQLKAIPVTGLAGAAFVVSNTAARLVLLIGGPFTVQATLADGACRHPATVA